MMRACHLNTCPVGIATQDPELRKRFKGTPEHVINFFFFVAEEVREILASLGLRSLDEAIGRVDLLGVSKAIEHWKARGVDLTHILTHIELPRGTPRRRIEPPPEVLKDALDWQILERSRPALEQGRAGARWQLPIRNRNRCVGGILSSHIAQLHGAAGTARGLDRGRLRGLRRPELRRMAGAGGDLHAARRRQRLRRQGPLRRRLRDPPAARAWASTSRPSSNVIVGNTVLYGATAGRAFFRGLAGERFAVRNSGAWALVEGIGDHGCEYMTGGRVVVLGPTGRNFAAGMSGGVAYVLDEDGTFAGRCNMGMVGFEALSPSRRARAAGDGRGAPAAHRLPGRGARARAVGGRCSRAGRS